MTEERDSQLSAMFDGELPGGECELLARRLAKDEALRAQWSRYSVIGAALRAERGVALHDRVAWRVQNSLAQEAVYGEGASMDSVATVRNPVLNPTSAASRSLGERWMRIARPFAGASIAAGVAAVSILWLRNQEASVPMMASSAPAAALEAGLGSNVMVASSPEASAPLSNGEPDRYVTPQPSGQTSIAPPARLANYVVAHSEYSGPLSRRLALLGLVATDPGEDGGLPEITETDPSIDADANDGR